MSLWRAVSLIAVCSFLSFAVTEGLLYPRETETREVKSLDGIWNFRLSHPLDSYKGHTEEWFLSELRETGPVIPMPVPASYNDITIDKRIRDHVGVAWYDRVFYVPRSWAYNQRIRIRFGSVCYAAQVWLNGVLVMGHEIGHLPFEAEVTPYIKFGEKNLITVAVDNTLLQTTIPQGSVYVLDTGNETILRQNYFFDFFNYAGIDRPVYLYTTPALYVSDITVVPSIIQNKGRITYRVDYEGEGNTNVSCEVRLLEKEGHVVAVSNDCKGNLTVISPKLWWPYLMNSDPGYLYTLEAQVTNGRVMDVYRLKVGIRSIRWDNMQLLINGEPVYIRGVGKHEDSDIRGKGLDLPVILKDYELLKWLGVNTFRTSHYPYADEIMDLADEMGLMVIDECPSVDTEQYTPTLLEKHKKSLTELIKRDKNRPSVIMWSVANEPRSQQLQAEAYFKEVVGHVKSLDTTRPVTIALSRGYNEDKTAKFLDIICFNRYNSWYHDTGITEIITTKVVREAQAWFDKFQKPIIMSEYGADAYPGIHMNPESVWSEEYQMVVLEEHFKAFDILRQRGFFIGEMLWNFADFKTAQTYTRVNGNKKGLFTRAREPKPSAFLLRARYNELANQLDNAPLPDDLYRYSSSSRTCMTESEVMGKFRQRL